MMIEALITCVHTSLRRRLRSSSFFLLLILLAALAAALVPSESASYSVVNAGGVRPRMSADTALVAAGTVLNVALLLVFAFAFNVWRHRDMAERRHLHAVIAPAPAILILTARICANIVILALVLAVAAILVSSTILARYGALPSGTSYVLFAAATLPVGALTVTVGFFLDALLPRSPTLRSTALFGLFIAAIMLSIVGALDIMGLNFLGEMIGGENARDISLGFINAVDQDYFIWRFLPDDSAAIALARLTLVPVMLAPLMFLVPAAARMFSRDQIKSLGRGVTRPAKLDDAEFRASTNGQLSAPQFDLPNVNTTTIAALGTVLYRYLRRSRLASLALLASFILGLAGAPAMASLSAAYLSLFMLFGRTEAEEVRMAATYERCEPALARPRASVFALLAALVAVLGAALPTLIGLNPVQALTAVAGLTFAAAWLDAAHRHYAVPVLGVSVLGGLYYIVAFNDIPPAADIFGLWSPSLTALALASVLAFASVALVARKSL